MRPKSFPSLAAAFAACCLLAASVETLGQGVPPAERPAAKSSAPAAAAAGDHAASQTRTPPESLDLRALWLEGSLADWLVLLLSIVVGFAAGKLAAAVLRGLARRWEARGWQARSLVVWGLAGPACLALLALGLTVGLAGLIFDLSHGIRTSWLKVLLLLNTIAVFWYGYNLVALVDVLLQRVTSRRETALDFQLAPLVRKTLRILLVIVGLLFVADFIFGRDIGAWLAGLGIAGLAVSLAAQDSLKNLFGSITILLDRPFRIGEQISYAGYDGVIEEIGFRSTKVRTTSGSLVNIPNSNIVNSPVENVSRRPYIRRSMNLAVSYNAPRAKMAQAVQILRDILAEEGIREPIHRVIQGQNYPPRVYFNEFNPANLGVSVTYWYSPPAYWDYMEHAQTLNLRICEEFAKAEIQLACPPPMP